MTKSLFCGYNNAIHQQNTYGTSESLSTTSS